jgi:hypothetical protein
MCRFTSIVLIVFKVCYITAGDRYQSLADRLIKININ